ncbi:MAG: ATP-dependent zinc metalloprotease FtsH [Candidatus Phytoplasma pruni]
MIERWFLLKKKSKLNIYNIVLFLLLLIIACGVLFYILKTLGFLEFMKKTTQQEQTQSIKLHDDTLEEIDSIFEKYENSIQQGNKKNDQNFTNFNQNFQEFKNVLKTEIKKIVQQMGGENVSDDLTEYEEQIEKLTYKIDCPNYESLKSLEQLIGLKTEKAALGDLNTCMTYSSSLERYQQKPPIGVIFHGVPGTGKTTLARALAKTTNFNYIEIDGTNFQKYNSKEGIKMVDALFKKTQEMERVIVCIDECENTWGNLTKAENQATKNIVTKFKNSFTSINNQNRSNKVFWIGTTNHLEDIDDAILSRFDYKIEVKPLDLTSRQEYFEKVFIAKLKQESLISEDAMNYLINELAPAIEHFPELKTFRDMEALIRLSIIKAIQRSKQDKIPPEQITKQDLELVFNNKKQEIADVRSWNSINTKNNFKK